ncbi:LysR substrate-binding domain-containing protein [Euzebya sp.]|uniref:LysR substrate-binding domain-containing protein n=1 Tax=Euzebya sp. TaxID=1971409 RepID=UPI00351372DF
MPVIADRFADGIAGSSVVAADHRLAGRDAVSIDDLADEPMLRHEGPQARRWDAFWNLDPRPDGSSARWGPVVHTLEEKLEYVAAGQAVGVIAASGRAARPPRRAGSTHRGLAALHHDRREVR